MFGLLLSPWGALPCGFLDCVFRLCAALRGLRGISLQLRGHSPDALLTVCLKLMPCYRAGSHWVSKTTWRSWRSWSPASKRWTSLCSLFWTSVRLRLRRLPSPSYPFILLDLVVAVSKLASVALVVACAPITWTFDMVVCTRWIAGCHMALFIKSSCGLLSKKKEV